MIDAIKRKYESFNHEQLIELIAAMLIFLLAILTLLSPLAFAHPISLSDAHLAVQRNKIVIALTLMYEDFLLYQEARADHQGYLSPEVLAQAINQHGSFLLNYVNLYHEQGKRLEGSIVKITESSGAKRGLKTDELMAHTLTYHLEYPRANLKLLTMSQSFPGGGALPALMDVIIEQEGYAPLRPLRLTNGGNRASIAFSWGPPRHSPVVLPIHSPQATMALNEKSFAISLTLPLPMLASLGITLPEAGKPLTVAEEKSLFPQIAERLRRAWTVALNDELRSSPHFAPVTLESAGGRKADGSLNELTATATVTQSFRRVIPLTKVTVRMNLFNQEIYELPVRLESGGETKKLFFTAYQPVHILSHGNYSGLAASSRLSSSLRCSLSTTSTALLAPRKPQNCAKP